MTSSKARKGRYLVTHDTLWEKVKELPGEFCVEDVLRLFENANPNAVAGGLTSLTRKNKLVWSRTVVHKSNVSTIYYVVNPNYDELDESEEAVRGNVEGNKVFGRLMGDLRYEDFIPSRLRNKQGSPS